MITSYAIRFAEPVAYRAGLEMQRRLLVARQENRIPDVVLLMRHLPVVTLGNRGRDNYLLKSEAEYRALGIDLIRVERGGDVTYHGPGQWVLYPILRLGENAADSHGYLRNLEEIAIRVLSDFGLEGFRREGKSGAWTDAGKIAAIGFRLKKWVSFHGMSFNVLDDVTAGFSTIVPCGLVGEPVASLRTLLADRTPDLETVGDALLNRFSEVCNRPLDRFSSTDALPDFLAEALRGAGPFPVA